MLEGRKKKRKKRKADEKKRKTETNELDTFLSAKMFTNGDFTGGVFAHTRANIFVKTKHEIGWRTFARALAAQPVLPDRGARSLLFVCFVCFYCYARAAAREIYFFHYRG